MSMVTCTDCGGFVDSDDDPDCFVEVDAKREPDYFGDGERKPTVAVKRTIIRCEPCREREETRELQESAEQSFQDAQR